MAKTNTLRARAFGQQPTLYAPFGASGYAALADHKSLTINSTTVQPSIWLEACDADLTSWDDTVNSTSFAIAGAGTDPAFTDYAPGITDCTVNFNAGKYFIAPSTTIGALTTKDIVMEAIFQANDGTVEQIVSKRSQTGAANNQLVLYTVSGILYAYISGVSGGGATVQLAVATSLINYHYYYVILFMDRSGNMRGYVNGEETAPLSISANDGIDIAADGYWAIGARSTDGGQPFSRGISAFGLWLSEAWLDTDDQYAIAAERWARVSGVYPASGTGTLSPTFARAYQAHVDKYDSSDGRILVPVGTGWPRIVQRKDASSDEIIGYLPEPEDENELLYSEDFSNAAWVKTRATVGSNAIAAPDGETTGDSIIGDATTNTHYVQQSIASSAGTHVFSVWLRPGNKTWAYLSAPEVANAYCYFHMSGNGTVGIPGAGVIKAGIQKWGDWYRCCLAYTGGAGAHNHRIAPADEDGDHTFLGDGATANIYVWGAQHEHQGEYGPSSYIKTTGAAATRLADDLTLNGDNVYAGQGRVTCNILLPNLDTQNDRYITSISDGGAATDHISLYQAATNDNLTAESAEAVGDAGSASVADDMSDNTIHRVEYEWRTDNLRCKSDGVWGTADTSVDIPDDIDEIGVGQRYDGTLQLGGVISQLKVFKK